MANEPQKAPRMGTLRKFANLVQRGTDNFYASTYYSDPTSRTQLQNIKSDITSSIKDIMDTNSDNVGEPNISKLYERLLMAQKDDGTIKEFERIFGDNEFINNLASSYLDNRWVKAVDDEIDEVMKYMPKLQEALDTIKDNVLSADSFSKDYLNLDTKLVSTRESEEQFSRNIDDMKTRYDLLKLTSEIYEKASKYGEVFVYCVPYTKAISALLKKKNSVSDRNISVRANFEQSNIMIESSVSEFEPVRLSYYNGIKKEDSINNMNYN